MSLTDHMNGMRQGLNMADVSALMRDREADRSIASWQSYAQTLRGLLETAKYAAEVNEGLNVLHGALAMGRADALDEMKAALRAVSPNHPLLADKAVRKIVDGSAARYAGERGFEFNAERRTVTRR